MLVVWYGLLAFWMTINSFNFSNPLVLWFAMSEIEFSNNEKQRVTLQKKIALMNSGVIAEFFNCICKAFFNRLLQTEQNWIEIFDQVNAHYAVIELNDHEMLHAHGFIWLKSNFNFSTLKAWIKKNLAFQKRMIQYLEHVVCKNIFFFLQENELPFFSAIFPVIIDGLSDEQISQVIYNDECTVAFYWNMHKCSSSCHKYENT